MGDEANAIRRVVTLLEGAAMRGGRIRFAEATALLAPIGPNTVARLLRELVRAGVLERGRDRAYAITEAPMFWAASVPQGRDLRAVARPHLVRLNRELAATAALAVPYRGRMTVLDRILDPESPSLMAPGTFAPLSPVHIGGIFLAAPEALADDAALRRWIASEPRPRIDLASLRQLIDQALADDVAVDPGLMYASLHRVSSPVRVDGRVVACLGIGASPVRGSAFMRLASRQVYACARAMAATLARAR
ncbi:MAG TPA: hypothetical protein VEL07_17985 [Planctomycetota bacterium]|nr:hypothetical protein [Planctomycetota bacterium]